MNLQMNYGNSSDIINSASLEPYHFCHLCFILIGAFISQVRVQSVAVLKHRNILQYILLCCMAGLVVPPLNTFLFKTTKETEDCYSFSAPFFRMMLLKRDLPKPIAGTRQ